MMDKKKQELIDKAKEKKLKALQDKKTVKK